MPWGAVASVVLAGIIMALWGYYLLSSASSNPSAASLPRYTANIPLTPSGLTPPPTLPPPPQMTPQELKSRLDGGSRIIILDARPFEEYAKSHIPGAISMPLLEIVPRFRELPRPSTIVTYGACL